ncbi:hypothetical protein GCM10010211_26910 [Streptomyces albospinus]|uniref:Uncharacterized protein n=1 Tax=Streptomyces albospinus TaxID=285515 RepID=A0ABQ2UYN5_9ACTN|nr:hypothetical protein GCM10010211_26910 [Streptomyces albospinus]
MLRSASQCGPGRIRSAFRPHDRAAGADICQRLPGARSRAIPFPDEPTDRTGTEARRENGELVRAVGGGTPIVPSTRSPEGVFLHMAKDVEKGRAKRAEKGAKTEAEERAETGGGGCMGAKAKKGVAEARRIPRTRSDRRLFSSPWGGSSWRFSDATRRRRRRRRCRR